MESYFAQLLIALQEHLKTQVTELRWIDQDFGQLENFEIRPDVSFPCALIDFAATEYSNQSQLAQVGDVTINIRLGFAPFSASSHIAPMDVREKALQYYEIEQKVYEALQGWGTEYTQPLTRVRAMSEQRDNDPAALRVRVITFTTGFEDLSATGEYDKVPATMAVEQEIDLN